MASRGRPRLYPEGADGAPIFNLRLNPEAKAWIQQHGGAGWARRILEAIAAGEIPVPDLPETPAPEPSAPAPPVLGDKLDEWVSEHGGAEYLRGLVARERQREMERLAREAAHRERTAFFDFVQKAVATGMADARNSHGHDLAGFEGSVGKRVAGRLWAWLHQDDEGKTDVG
ncbi:MAG TPA: hypothetical protein VGO93_16730 [Candidatus Xenobia bacterium]|jgi:hypothetical protein